MAREVILPEVSATSVLNSPWGYCIGSNEAPFTFVVGETYVVVWDGAEFTCEAVDGSVLAEGAVVVGNAAPFGLAGNNEPFVLGTIGTTFMVACLTDTEPTEHTIAIYTATGGTEGDAGGDTETEGTANPNDVLLKGYDGVAKPYQAVPKVWLTGADGESKVPFTYGEVLDDLTIEPDFSGGDQTITVPDGYLVKEVTLIKPDDLASEYIAKDKEICGVPGSLVAYEPEEVTVDGDTELSFADGDYFVVEPTADGKLMSKVTIGKPSDLVPENIAKGRSVAGIPGAYEGAGALDEALRYFKCHIDSATSTITLYGVFYDLLYADTGSYDVTIPDQINGFDVVISSV